MIHSKFFALWLEIIFLTFPFPAGAQTKLGVGIYAPEIPFSGPQHRFRVVQGIAQHLSTALGIPVEAVAYKKAADFERDLKTHKVHFAILGALYIGSKRGLKVVAVSQLQSPSDSIWSIMAKSKAPIASLQGKVIQIPSMGPLTNGFIQYGLLDGIFDIKNYFRINPSPDLKSAIAAVQVGQADAVVAPIGTQGLVPLIGGRSVPPPAFVVLDTRLSSAIITKATSAMLSYGGSGSIIQGWKASDISAYQALAGITQKRALKMVLSASDISELDIKNLIDMSELHSKLPPLEELFWIP